MAVQTAAQGAGAGGPLGFIRNMPRNQQMILLGAVAVVIVIGLIVAVGGQKEEAYVPVWTRLAPRDAGDLTAKLQEAKIPYKLMEGGTAVAVPKDKADVALVSMAMKGLPKDGVVGNEIFDKQNFLSTDFEKRVNAQRAMEGELTRLIRKFDGIEDASVKVVVPEPQLFAEQQKPTTAAVMVRFAPGRDWKGGQVEAITHLIASSVPGLPASHVTVVDASGVILTKGIGSEMMDPTSQQQAVAKQLDEQMQFKKQWERDLELRVMDMLDRLVGPNQSRAQVVLDIDFNRKQMRDNKVAPFMGPDGKPVPLAQRYGYELNTMQGGGQGAPPGTASNQGGTQTTYQATGQTGTQQSTPGGGSTAEKRTEQYQSLFNKTEELTQAMPGVIKRLSATVLVSEKWPEDRQKDLEAMVKAALGSDPSRQDNVVVQRVKWDTTLEDELKKKMKAGAAVSYTLYYILGGLGAVVLLAILLRPKKKEEEAPPMPPPQMAAAPPPPAMPGAEAAVAGLSGAIGTYTNVPPPGAPMPGAEEPGLALPPEGMAVARSVAVESPFDFLLGVPAETVAQLLSGERLPTLVAVIAQLSHQQAEQVVARLSPEVQEEVRSRLASNPVLPPMTQKMVSQSLKKRLAAMNASRV